MVLIYVSMYNCVDVVASKQDVVSAKTETETQHQHLCRKDSARVRIPEQCRGKYNLYNILFPEQLFPKGGIRVAEVEIAPLKVPIDLHVFSIPLHQCVSGMIEDRFIANTCISISVIVSLD